MRDSSFFSSFHCLLFFSSISFLTQTWAKRKAIASFLTSFIIIPLLIKEIIAKQKIKTTMGRATGEIYQDRSKGKDVRTSNIVSAKVNSIFFVMLDGQPRYYVSSSLTGIV